jgi:hypothetical protein
VSTATITITVAQRDWCGGIDEEGIPVKLVRKLFTFGYSVIAALFGCSALALIIFAVGELWHGINPGDTLAIKGRLNAILESIGLLTIAVAALELGQTILEEEVLREAHMSTPTRVRRFLSRFMIVIIVSLSIESLVAVFQFIHGEPLLLPQAAVVTLAAAVLLAAWGIFVKFNTSAEELEPEAMAETKREDHIVE